MDPNTPLRSLSQRLAEPPSVFRTASRRQQFTDHEINPLLSNLSPSSTLEALVATDAVPTGTRRRRSFIQDSVASASTSERAWGIKAALAGKKLREWYGEISEWSWPAYKARGSREEASWGILSVRTVKEREERLEVIRDDMETLEVEDLKNYVRSTHLRSGARKPSISSVPMEYDHLGDFTAIITATIVQVLPTLSRLTSLLDIWTTRLVILRQVPGFLRDMTDCQESMLSAWMAVERPGASTARRKPLFLRQTFLDVQAVLKDQIAQLGRRLDNMLDLLEGSQDALPERWIDDLEDVEKEYSSWVVRAEDQVLSNELGEMDREEHDRSGAAAVQTKPSDNNLLERSTDSNAKAKDVFRGEDTNHEEVLGSIPPEPGYHERDDSYGLDNDKSSNGLHHHSLPKESANPVAHATMPLHTIQAEPAIPLTRIDSNTSKSLHRPTPLVLGDRTSSAINKTSDADLETSDSESVISDYFSDKSSPELRSASVVEYVCSPTVSTSPWSSGDAVLPLSHASQPSGLQIEQRPEHDVSDNFAAKANQQRSRASTCLAISTNDVDTSVSRVTSGESSFTKSHGRTRSASMQSVGTFPKNEVRKVTIRRSGSYTLASSESKELSPEAVKEFDLLPVITRSQKSSDFLRKSPPAKGDRLRKDQPESRSLKHLDTDLDTTVLVPSVDEELAKPTSPHRFQQVMDMGPGLTPVKIRRKTPGQDVVRIDGDLQAHPQISGKPLPQNPDDRLEARINSILTEIPAHIRLTSGPEPDAPEVTRFMDAPQTPVTRPSATRLTRAQTSIAFPTMTLAPAQPKSVKPRPQNGEPEIKLYHLHQAGKDVPIKLFVRLVGEAGERVMVRIGGGWADLAEYLKEYASHHGRRSVSDTRFDIQGIPSSPISQASSSSQQASPMPSRPSPGIAFKRQQTTPGKFESPQTPVSDPSVRSESRMSWTEEDSPSLGLAGPKTKKVEISPRKQAWVDEMIDQARGGVGGVAIGNMGKVGGTKRVFLKGRSRAGSNV